MAYTFKNKRLAYDNIAVGSATGQERHIAGGGGIETTKDGLDNVVVSADGTSYTLNRVRELPIAGHSSDAGNPTNIPGSTSDSSFYTSTTSWTTVFPERL